MKHRDDNADGRSESDINRMFRAVTGAAADPAPPHEPPPYFAARIRSRARAGAAGPDANPVGRAAARLLPAFGALALIVVCAAGFETVQASHERDAAVARALAQGAGGDALVGAILLSNPDARQGGTK